MKGAFIKLLVLAALVTGAASSRATTIAADPNEIAGNTEPASDYGETSQTPLDFLYDNVAFNFYPDAPAATPVATGKLFS